MTEEEEEFVYTGNEHWLVLIGGIGIIALILYGRSFIGPQKYGQLVDCNAVEIYYKGEATKEDALRLCKDLDHPEEGTTTPQTSIQLIKEKEVYSVKFIIKESMQKEEDILHTLQLMADRFSKNTFEHQPVEIHICNAGFKTVDVLESSN